MPKRQKQRRSSKRAPGGNFRTKFITYAGTRLLQPLPVGGVVSVSLQPNLLDNGLLANLSDTFQLYRCVKIKVKLFPNGQLASVGYINGLSDSPPGSIGDISSMPYNTIVTISQTTPSSFTVPREFLLAENSMKWWRTRVSTAGTPSTDAWETTQGTLWFSGNNAATIPAEVYYKYEFADAMVIGMTPHPRPPPISLSTAEPLPTFPVHLVGCPYQGMPSHPGETCFSCRLLSLKH